MESRLLNLRVKVIFILIFTIMISLSVLIACSAGDNSDDVLVDTVVTDFVSTLCEYVLSERIQAVSDNSFFFGGADLGMSSSEMKESVAESRWFVGCIDRIISGVAESENRFYPAEAYFYTNNSDLVIATIFFENSVLSYIGVEITYDVPDPTYEQFVSLSRAQLKSFMDAEGIEEMSIVESCSDNVSYNLMLDTYAEAGYKTNEITYREYVDDESGIVYSHVVEHYEKEDPDESLLETPNIAKIFYSKSYIQ